MKRKQENALSTNLVGSLQSRDDGLDVGDLLLGEQDEGVVVFNLGS